MMSTQLSELYPRVQLEVPGCPAPLVLQSLVDVIREFCERTLSWQYEMDAISVVADVDTYDLDDVPSCAELVCVLSATLSDGTLKPITDYTIPASGDDPKQQIVLENPPDADATGALVIVVALRPKLSATVICDRLFADWYQAWADGAKAALMMMPRKAWSNPQLGMVYRQNFEVGIAKAIHENNRGRTVTPLMATPMYPW